MSHSRLITIVYHFDGIGKVRASRYGSSTVGEYVEDGCRFTFYMVRAPLQLQGYSGVREHIEFQSNVGVDTRPSQNERYAALTPRRSSCFYNLSSPQTSSYILCHCHLPSFYQH